MTDLRIGQFRFSLQHEGHGKWTALVFIDHPTMGSEPQGYVQDANGTTIVRPNFDAMIRYLRYAYAREKE